ncbi:MAG: SMC-Scp complex subunit ScpB [Candidatus Binatia bacterium]
MEALTEEGAGGPGMNEKDERAETAGVAEEEGTAPVLIARLDGIVESLLFTAGVPLSLRRMLEVLDGPTAKEIVAAIDRLKAEYNRPERGVHLVDVAGGFQLRSAPANAEWVRALLRERPARLGRAALETLAVIAYKQPTTRAEVEAVRGVDCDSAISTLLARKLIRIAGRKEAVGRPLMYATTSEFLEVFSLNDLSQLPALKEIGPVEEPEDDAAIDDAERWAAATEDSQPGGGELAASRGSDDPGGPGDGERPHGDGAGDPGESAQGSDRD